MYVFQDIARILQEREEKRRKKHPPRSPEEPFYPEHEGIVYMCVCINVTKQTLCPFQATCPITKRLIYMS